MSNVPSDKLLEEARIMAILIGKTVYLCEQGKDWQISESLQEIPSGACIIEIRPESSNNQTCNFSGY